MTVQKTLARAKALIEKQGGMDEGRVRARRGRYGELWLAVRPRGARRRLVFSRGRDLRRRVARPRGVPRGALCVR
jgi:hypothetical protein